LLEDIGHSFQPTSAAVSAQVGGIHWGLFRNKAMGDPTQTEILRVAFLCFAMNHWGRGSVDHKVIRELGGTGPKRFLTQTESAVKISVRQSTAVRLLRSLCDRG